MHGARKPLAWLHGEIKTPPLSKVVLKNCQRRLARYDQAAQDTPGE
jgi:hypothetical protein